MTKAVLLILTGVLGIGTPVCAQETASLEGEAQIQKPEAGEETAVLDDPTDNTYDYYTIMGNTTVTAEQMIQDFENHQNAYPSKELEKGGAPAIEDFCEILLEEAKTEGVRGEVVFVQCMLETGWLQFQGDAKIEQFNFSGLGTTGNGEQGNSFSDVRTGLRAQVQHLKAYASSEELVQECVDLRFDYVARETAPYVEWLGIQENPYGTGWAAAEGYGSKLRELLSELKEIEDERAAVEVLKETPPTPALKPDQTPTPNPG